MRTYNSYAMLYILWKYKRIPHYFIEYFRSILSVKAGFSKDYDQYNYFYYNNYFSSMRPRILTPLADRNIYVEPDFFFLVYVKYFPGIHWALLGIMVKSFRLCFLPPKQIYKMIPNLKDLTDLWCLHSTQPHT